MVTTYIIFQKPLHFYCYNTAHCQKKTPYRKSETVSVTITQPLSPLSPPSEERNQNRKQNRKPFHGRSPPPSKGREVGTIIKSWRGNARNRALFRAYRMKQGERKIGKQVFFQFSRGDWPIEGPPPLRPTLYSEGPMLPRRDDTRVDEIPGLLSGGTRFKIYPRRVAFAIPKRRDAVWIRWVGRPGRQLDRACGDWGINTSFKYRARPLDRRSCITDRRVFNAIYMIQTSRLLNVTSPKRYWKYLFIRIVRSMTSIVDDRRWVEA